MKTTKIHRTQSLILAGLAMIALASLLGALATRVVADNSSATYDYLIGTDFLCGLGIPNACPDVAKADNGDTVEITGSGTLSVHPKSVTGEGTYTHNAADGSTLESGTWTATQLLSFNVADCGVGGFPPNFCGGLAIILVQLSSGSGAILQVYCDIGTPPPSYPDPEGVRLAIQGGLNFNQKVSGITVFIRE